MLNVDNMILVRRACKKVRILQTDAKKSRPVVPYQSREPFFHFEQTPSKYRYVHMIYNPSFKEFREAEQGSIVYSGQFTVYMCQLLTMLMFMLTSGCRYSIEGILQASE